MINFFSYPTKYYKYIVLVLGGLFFIPFLGHLHLFDWDEINFAESSREMLISRDYFHVQINYMPFWEKPPLVMWLQSLSMYVFGVSEFAARFPNALFGIITLLSLYVIGKKHVSSFFGLIWALVYLMSFLPHIYFKSGIIDPIFNYFIFLSIYFLIQTIHLGKTKFAIVGGVFAGLAFLSKGPVALLLIILTYLIYQIITKFKQWGTLKQIALFTLSSALISFIWILPEVFKNGFSTLGDFITYQIRLLTTGDAGHEQPFFYHPLVVFIGCFPMSVFAIPLVKQKKYVAPMDLTKWMAVLFWVVMILFTIVKTKIVHYSSMCWMPMSFCAAYYIYTKYTEGQFPKIMLYTFACIGILFSALLIALPLIGYYRMHLIPYLHDDFAIGCLKLPVQWQLWTMVWGVLFCTGIITGYFLLRKNMMPLFLTLQSITTGITLFGFLLTVVPNIEAHSQRPAIEFYESLKDKDVYVAPMGFKSYAHYFYFAVPNSQNELRQNEDFLLYQQTDKPVYLVTKINSDFLDNRPNFDLLYTKGGFKFYKRTK